MTDGTPSAAGAPRSVPGPGGSVSWPVSPPYADGPPWEPVGAPGSASPPWAAWAPAPIPAVPYAPLPLPPAYPGGVPVPAPTVPVRGAYPGAPGTRVEGRGPAPVPVPAAARPTDTVVLVVPATPSDVLPEPVPVDAADRRGRPWLPVLATAACVGLLVGLLAGGVGGVAARRAQPASVLPASVLSGGGSPQAASSVPATVTDTLPAVVTVAAPGATRVQRGSGFVLRADGHIVTNLHVLGGVAKGGTVDVTLADGTVLDGTVVGTSEAYDIAVVKVDRPGLPAVRLGDSSKVRVGDEVVAIGSPLGLAGTVTTGIVSARDRPVSTDSGYLDTLQTDAAVNPGSSGGPLLDAEGAVVGLTWVPTDAGGSNGLGFAIPVNAVSRVAGELIATGKARTPVIGVDLDPKSAETAATVLSVDPDGPAADAGLQAGDVVHRFDGRLVPDAVTLIGAIRDKAPGDVVRLTIVRGFRQQDVSVTLGAVARD